MSLIRVIFLILMLSPAVAFAQNAPGARAFPGAEGWAAQTPGGRGGRIMRVINLNANGPGSFRAALEAQGPRIIVFEVAGVIDMGLTTWTIDQPFLTIAGQTAPSPGITLIRGGIDIRTHDVIVRHIRIRTGVSGQALRSGWEADALSTIGAYNVIVDHCTLTWALDENLSASGPRFTGSTPAEWRRGHQPQHHLLLQSAGRGARQRLPPEGRAQQGLADPRQCDRDPDLAQPLRAQLRALALLKGGVHAAIVNNLIYNPGAQAIHYNLMDLEWGDRPHQLGEMTAVGNVLRGGFSTRADIAFLTIGGVGDLRYHGRDNLAVDRQGRPLPMFGRYTTSPARIIAGAAPGGLARGPARARRRTRSRPTCSATPAPAPGTATRTTSA